MASFSYITAYSQELVLQLFDTTARITCVSNCRLRQETVGYIGGIYLYERNFDFYRHYKQGAEAT